MEPADPLPEKPALSDSELKGEQIVLEHHSMLTPSDYNFSVLRNPAQNFKYRGILWLTDHRLIYKGFPVLKMGAVRVSEKLMKPFCEMDTAKPYTLIISLEDIAEIFSGHDSTFQKRFQRYPKLRLQIRGGNGTQTLYFYLTRENLIDDELYINKRCEEWTNKIRELKNKLVGIKPAPEVPTAPAAPTAKAGAPIAATTSSVPKAAGVGTDGLLKEALASVEGKKYGKVVVKPLEEREKPKFTALTKPIKPVEEEEEIEPEFTKLLDTLVPVSDEEFAAAAADTSIARCPHCGWILSYATSKCPRCRKEI